jgi:putative transcriptional regulator
MIDMGDRMTETREHKRARLIAEYRQVFKSHLKTLRAKHDWTQGDVAAAAGLSTLYVGRLEQGKHEPSLTTLVQLAHAFGITVAELVLVRRV